ncbi:ferrochelatase, partial [Francisella tularensis]|uniref:ferrochelatase n=1 Tax=Francisella tularensis TaxID=263 RepID=UPI003C6D6841
AKPILWNIKLNFIIIQISAKKNINTYKTVWNKQNKKSPLLYYTENLADKLDKKLDNYNVDYAMR